MRSPKYPLILLMLAASGLALLAATQQWYTVTVASGAGGSTVLTVDGQVASPALSALGFAGLALAVALAIAGPVIRIVLGVLGALLGGSIVLAAGIAIGDPAAASLPVVTKATGVAGHETVRDLIESVTATAWPIVALAAGILLVVASLAVIVTARAWPASARKYQAVRMETAEPSAKDRAVDEWDELSRGDDPTA